MDYTYSDKLYSDFHKDAFGFRPSTLTIVNWIEMTPDEKQAEWDSIRRVFEYNQRQEELAKQRATQDFESLVELAISVGAKDRETAIRWLTKDEDFDHSQDVEHWVYNQGLLFTDTGRELVALILQQKGL